MINQYDNGFTFRFSGGGGRLMALAVDFRQKVFKPGQSYRVDIEVPPYVDVALPGTAYNEATLIVNTQEIDGFYKNISDAKTMKLGVGSSRMEFTLLGVPDGLSRIEGCYSGGGARAAPVAPVPVGHSPTPPEEAFPPQEQVITPMPDEAIPQVPPASGGQADTGAAVDAMLQDAAREAKRVEPAAAPAVQETSEQRGQMLARGWVSSSAPTAKNAAPRQIMASTGGGARAAGEPQRRWRAMNGASLHDALAAWAGEAGVELMWMAGQDFSVVKSISMQGSFEAAVLSLLGQYEETDLRPVGRIYNGREAGRKVLLVETHRDY